MGRDVCFVRFREAADDGGDDGASAAQLRAPKLAPAPLYGTIGPRPRMPNGRRDDRRVARMVGGNTRHVSKRRSGLETLKQLSFTLKSRSVRPNRIGGTLRRRAQNGPRSSQPSIPPG